MCSSGQAGTAQVCVLGVSTSTSAPACRPARSVERHAFHHVLHLCSLACTWYKGTLPSSRVLGKQNQTTNLFACLHLVKGAVVKVLGSESLRHPLPPLQRQLGLVVVAAGGGQGIIRTWLSFKLSCK